MSGSATWTGLATPFVSNDWLALWVNAPLGYAYEANNWSTSPGFPYGYNLSITGFTTKLGFGESFLAKSVDLASSTFSLLGTVIDTNGFTVGPHTTMSVLQGGVAELVNGTMSFDAYSTLAVGGQVKIDFGSFDGANAVLANLAISPGGTLDVGAASNGSFTLTSPVGLTFVDDGALDVGGNFTLQARGGTMSIVSGTLAMNQYPLQMRGADLIDNAGGTVSVVASRVIVGVQEPFATNYVLQLGQAGDGTVVNLVGSSISGGGSIDNRATVTAVGSTISAKNYFNDGTGAVTEVSTGKLSFQSNGRTTPINSASSGTFSIGNNGTLDLGDNNSVGGADVSFSGSSGVLAVTANVGHFTSLITGFGGGTELEIEGETLTGASYDGVHTVTATETNGQTVTFSNLSIAGASAGPLKISNQGNNGFVELVCFCRGVHILTTRGEIAVEDLRVGDMAVTFLGRGPVLKSVRWLGQRLVDLKRHPSPEAVRPVRIRAGALVEGRPSRDLLVSPGHRLPLGGRLICAVDLVNGASIVQETPDQVEYWHVEVDGHDILLADGVEAESYHDTGNRAWFEGGTVVLLHAALDGEGLTPCLPYAEASADLRAQLHARAEALGWVTVSDPAPWLEVSGVRVEPLRRGGRYRFLIPQRCTEVRLCSRASRPRDVDPNSGDTRRLGLSLQSLVLQTSEGRRDVALEDARLGAGFSYVEQDADGWIWRWTDGNALLPLALLAPNETVTAVEIAIDQGLRFWIEPPHVRQQQMGMKVA